MNQVATTLICLFHDRNDAESVREDLVQADVPEQSITLIHRDGSDPDAMSGLSDLDLPIDDLHHLLNGLEHGDTVLTVDSDSHLVDKVDAIFRAHEADPVSESDSGEVGLASATPELQSAVAPSSLAGAPAGMADNSAGARGGATILPVLREEFEVGKRSIEAGGMRVFRRSVEVPFNQEAKLRDQSGQVEQRAVDHPGASTAASQQGSLDIEQVIELTETREELVITKAARVIEEVVVGRETADRIQHVEETLRHTEIEVQQISPGDGKARVRGAELAPDDSLSRNL